MNRKISSGIYLVIDPLMEEAVLLAKLEVILQENISAVQIWDNFSPQQDPMALIKNITELCHKKEVPVLINNKWELLNRTALDGVHFDAAPENIMEIRAAVGRGFIGGLTCNNDLSIIKWADENRMDYISFCSVFPSTTSNSCELVKFETILAARKITAMPLFLAGGIRPENMPKLAALSFDGIAVISGVMSSDDPAAAVRAYSTQLNNRRYES